MRKKVFFASIVFLVTMLFAVVGWAAVYYLSPSGSATPPYDTWKKAANNLSQILSLDLTGENTIYVAEGTYSGSDNYIALAAAKFANLSIIGRGKANQVIFSSGTNTSCYIDNTSISNVSFENITIENNASYAVWVENGDNIKFVDCNIVGKGGHSNYLIRVRNSSSVILDHCICWTDSYNSASMLAVLGSATLQINYSCCYSPNGSFTQYLYHNSTGNVSIANCIFAKSVKQAISHIGTGDLTISNSIVLGSYWQYHNVPTVYRESSAGNTLIRNSVVLPSTYFPNNFYSSGVTTENVIEDDPHLKPFSTRAFIIPRVDDNTNLTYAQNLANLLKEYGYKGSFFIYTHDNPENIADELRALIQDGVMEIGAHTYSHTDLIYNHALHFEYSGSDANPTVELDSSRVIHLRTDGSDNVDIDTTQPDADTLGEIISNYSGTNNWTISKSSTDGQNPSNITDICKSECLAEMSATSAPCDIDFWKVTNCENGCPGFYGSEIYEPKVEITNLINAEGNVIDPQTGQTYEARTFVPPFGAGDEDVVEALRTSGYIGAGGITSFIEEALPYNVFKIAVIMAGNLIVDGDEEQTTKNAELFAINAAVNGLAVTVLAHNESEATLEEWRWILNGFKRAQEAGYNIQVTSLQLAIEALKRLGTYDPSTGDVDIHRSMPSFKLRHDSPCIDAGIKLPIHDENWRDLAGNRIRYGTAPDIGCYEYRTWPRGAWGMLPWIGGRHKVQWTPYE